MASSTRRPSDLFKMLALALLLIATLAQDGVGAQEEEEEVVTGTTPALETMHIRGDMIATEEPGDFELKTDFQVMVFPTDIFPFLGTVAPVDVDQAPEEEAAAQEEEVEMGEQVEPGRGDAQPETQAPVIITMQDDVTCVGKEKIQDRDTVSLTLRSSSTCEETKQKIQEVLEILCGDDCKLDVYQEDNSNQILISGPYIDEDAQGMADKFSIDNIKDKVGVEDAVPHWGKNSKAVLIALLLAGLILAALLVAGYYLKTHRGKTAKGVRLAESFQVDEENQANTLVSVAPLPQEPLDKPTVNGESAPESPPPTNGHSATQTPVADTEM